jgi:hypothetical protein
MQHGRTARPAPPPTRSSLRRLGAVCSVANQARESIGETTIPKIPPGMGPPARPTGRTQSKPWPLPSLRLLPRGREVDFSAVRQKFLPILAPSNCAESTRR